jgi:hypothetical protein
MQPYVENYTNKEDANGKEIHVVEINLEDSDTEKVTGQYILEAAS